MSKANISALMKNAQVWMTKHSPEILTGLGIAGMITTTVLAVKATPKALRLIDDRKDELGMYYDEKLPVIETVKAAWKPYIPVVVTGGVSIACLVGASSVNLRRNTALAAAYHLSETALSEYKEKVIETIGEHKEKNIRDKIFVILEAKKEPMHFSEIAAEIKKSNFKRKNVTIQAIHNELIKDARFVLIGRGIYALSSWGYKKGTISDIIKSILEKAGKPLTREEIVKQVLKVRKVKETTILLNLQNKALFKKVDKNSYTLA